MPLFRNKFHPKKCPPRKNNVLSNIRRDMDSLQMEKEFNTKVERIRLDLGSSQIFELNPCDASEKWVCISLNNGKTSEPTTTKFDGENMLKLQVEVLLDMLTETTVDAHIRTSGVASSNANRQKRNPFRGRKLF